MKKTYLFVFFNFICSVASSQNTFEKIIDTLGAFNANCIQQTFDGGYVLCGNSHLNGNDAIAIKLDSTGFIEWAKTYSGPSIEGANRIEQLPDSSYIMDGAYDNGSPPQYHRHWLLHLDVNGDTLLTSSFSLGGGGATQATAMTVNNNGNYGLTGYFTNNPLSIVDAYLIVSNDSGSVIASKIYYSAYQSQAQGICKTNTNGYAITGALSDSSAVADAYLIRTDSFGDTLWTKTYNHSQIEIGWAVQQTADDGFIIAGYMWPNAIGKNNIYIVKTDSSGDSIWTKTYYSPVNEEALSIEQTMDGGYIITGTGAGVASIKVDLYLIKTDSLGDTLWTRKFGQSGTPETGYFVHQTTDGGYIITGSGYNGGMPGIYVIKTDSMGRVTTSIGVAEVNNPLPFKVYPNPTTGIFTVELKGIPYNKGDIEINNFNNQSIYHCIVANHSTLRVDLSNEADGMYVIALRTKANIFSKKIIIQK